ncbi:MAG: phosphoribosylanthranilate isomerase, partial [Lachnospiraceae bacterium]|nr:phosphoribosylanthranilate isomerase [Lachnospiraceae bacterium]
SYLNEYGADYGGFVLFCPKSPRNVCLERAKEIIAALNPGIGKVAVCVNITISQANAIADAGFDILQLHGAMFPEVCMNARLPIWRALTPEDEVGLKLALRQRKIEALLFDAPEPGGGETFDWEAGGGILSQEGEGDLLQGKKLFLAGGLTPENVAEALDRFHPFGVDVSSGVEWEGLPKGSGKDPEKIKKFIEAVREWDKKKTQS